ncbi:hypothetical protein [Rhizobium leguminosarum]|uniref:hypothetical protein n=1 Tax=Rhizobium leguminosarum TaxID=384 RepID=UPI002E13D71E|nr:hypothetical protein U8Q02_41640 [Rhizobium leguminosarum]
MSGKRDGKFSFMDDLDDGLTFLVRVVIATVIGMLGVIVWLSWMVFFSSPEKTAVRAPSAPAPVYSPVVPYVRPLVASHMGECFSTPMGDIGKVIEQDNEMLTMAFRGGVKSTYRFDQVTSSACGPAVVK